MLRLRALHIQPGINLDAHSRHTRILGQHDKGVHTILQLGILFQCRSVLQCLDALGAVLFAPFSQQEAWQDSIDTNLGSFCDSEAFDEVQLCSFGYAVGH